MGEVGHEEADSANNQVRDYAAVDVPETEVSENETNIEEADGPEQADSVNNQVTDDAVRDVPETGVSVNDINAGNNEAAEEYLPQRAVRKRRPPNMLTLRFDGQSYGISTVCDKSVQATNPRFPLKKYSGL